MLQISDLEEMREWSRSNRVEGRTVGLVPTMGYLHEGHLRLIDRGREAADALVISIFVNPIQFGPSEDFLTYPRDLERDLKLIEQRGGDCAFVPRVEAMYRFEPVVRVSPGSLTDHLCGPRRPGHFEGRRGGQLANQATHVPRAQTDTSLRNAVRRRNRHHAAR